MKTVLILCFCLMVTSLMAQQDAWVYLTDKPNVEVSLSNPSSILSQKAINRKTSQGILIDERDVPVNETYITQLKNQPGITVLAKSKWFNAVHVRGSENDINVLLSLEFVDEIDFADNSLDTSTERFAAQSDKFDIENSQVNFNYGNTQNQIEMIGVNQLHWDDFTGEGITIAILDAGFTNVNILDAFQRLRDNNDLLGGYDFVDRTEDIYAFSGNDHGTKVLSTMAAYVENQYVGTAPDASYYLFRTEDVFSENPVEESYWVEAAERADSLGVDMINTSLGYTQYDNSNYSYTPSDMNGNTAFITKGATIATEKGILVVASAGNSGTQPWQIVGAPADASEVLSVGAVDANGNYVTFSSQGDSTQPSQKPDVVAQGGAAFVIGSNGAIVNNNGTSFSAPILAGGVACLLQALPEASNEEIIQFVRMSSSQYESPDNFLGYGIPNLANAYQIGLSVLEENAIEFKVFPNPADEILQIQMPLSNGNVHLKFINVLGTTVLEYELTNSWTELDVSELSSGIYMLFLQSENFKKTIKLIKQ